MVAWASNDNGASAMSIPRDLSLNDDLRSRDEFKIMIRGLRFRQNRRKCNPFRNHFWNLLRMLCRVSLSGELCVIWGNLTVEIILFILFFSQSLQQLSLSLKFISQVQLDNFVSDVSMYNVINILIECTFQRQSNTQMLTESNERQPPAAVRSRTQVDPRWGRNNCCCHATTTTTTATAILTLW